MKINQLTLRNYRGAQALSLDFDDKLNIFYGVNGSGKSTVLDSIAIMLSWVVSRLRHSGTSGRPILESDITNGTSAAAIAISVNSQEQQIDWRLVKGRKMHHVNGDRTNLTKLNEFVKQLQNTISDSQEKVNLPIFVYYPVNRAVLDIPLRIKEKHSFSLFTAYDDALTSGANFRTFFEWFREREDLENENRKYLDAEVKPEGFCFPDPQLHTVRDALKQFLPEFENFTVRRNPLRMEVSKNGICLTVNQLSDGEKCLIAMVGDLARRIAIANPMLTNPLNGEGIILIDEIDLHLHPKWQRMVVSKLIDVFPHCQFIASTHSPHVITHVHPKNLYLLKQIESGMTAERPTESYGKNIDRILEDLMGLTTTRPDAVTANLHQIYEQISIGQITDAKQLISQLKSEIGSDPELVKAEVLIKRKESIGK